MESNIAIVNCNKKLIGSLLWINVNNYKVILIIIKLTYSLTLIILFKMIFFVQSQCHFTSLIMDINKHLFNMI